jgi:D-lactate dehydrogenase (cytochrome)
VLYAAEQKEKARRIISETQRLGIEMDGTVTGEHGIGLEFRDMLDVELGVETVDAMRRIKLALDPLCLLNPDKMVRIEKQL